MSTETDETRRCGRPTRSGAPCRSPLYGPVQAYPSCKLHWTEHDTAVTKAYDAGIEEGEKRGRSWAELDIANLKQKVKRLQKKIDKADDARRRMADVQGRQIVQVKGYSYTWDGETPLQIGDQVLLPGNWVSPSGWVGEVSELGTLYEGALQAVVRRMDDDDG